MDSKKMNAKEARDRGEKRYFTGRPCKRGHIAQRLTANNHCTVCLADRNAQEVSRPGYLAKKREWYRRTGARYQTGRNAEQQRAYYAANKETIAPRKVEQARRRNMLAKAAMPKWADPASILSFYEAARALTASTGVPHEVDHVVPFRSKTICGLHVQNNLQVITGTASSSMNNLHVFFWTDSQQAQNVTLDIGKVQLEVGSVATPLAVRSIQEEQNLCFRYLYVTGSSGNSIGTWLSSTAAFMVGALPVPMRTTSPTNTIYGGGSTVSVECFGSGTSTSTSAFPGASQTTWNLNVNTLSPARSANAPAFNKNAFVINARL